MPVKLQPEPPHFFVKVRRPGEEFLLQNPGVKGSKLKQYWREIIPDLYDAYGGICAYTCHKVEFDTGAKTVEHFKPKEKYPQDAYRWDNYRFVCSTLNGRKGNHEDVLDPFTLQDGWFIMHFPSLQLRPGQHLSGSENSSVWKTINRLKLNDYTCVRGRRDRLVPYLLGKYPFSFLEEIAPFLARELRRQKFDNVDLPIWMDFKKYGRTS